MQAELRIECAARLNVLRALRLESPRRSRTIGVEVGDRDTASATSAPGREADGGRSRSATYILNPMLDPNAKIVELAQILKPEPLEQNLRRSVRHVVFVGIRNEQQPRWICDKCPSTDRDH